MKKSFLLILFFLMHSSVMLFSQNVGINNDASQPHNSAMLDVKSTEKGLLIPRMTMAERDDIDEPATGLMIYQTNNTAGFYYYNGSAWTSVGAAAAPSSPGLSEYAYIYNLDAVVVAIESDIEFSNNGNMTAGFTHTPGESSITIVNAGIYSVWFNVSAVEPCQFALFQNGAPVAGGIYGSGAGTQINSGMIIITAAAGDVLSLRNHTSSAAVTLQFLAGGTQFNVNASIMIHKLD